MLERELFSARGVVETSRFEALDGDYGLSLMNSGAIR